MQAGAGIVADSDPEYEFRETERKWQQRSDRWRELYSTGVKYMKKDYKAYYNKKPDYSFSVKIRKEKEEKKIVKQNWGKFVRVNKQ